VKDLTISLGQEIFPCLPFACWGKSHGKKQFLFTCPDKFCVLVHMCHMILSNSCISHADRFWFGRNFAQIYLCSK